MIRGFVVFGYPVPHSAIGSRQIWILPSETRVGIFPLWRGGLPPFGSEAAPKLAADFLGHSASPGLRRLQRFPRHSAATHLGKMSAQASYSPVVGTQMDAYIRPVADSNRR